MASFQPCVGIRASHYPDGELRQGYGSLVRQALRNGLAPDGAPGMGHFPSFRVGGVSATLHVVRDEHVFWHTECGVFAKVNSSPLRCNRCATYNARTFLAKVKEAASQELNMCTVHSLLSSPQKVWW